MRSILTSLGIIIGVSAVIIMLAVGSGASKKIAKDMESMGSNLLMIRSSSATTSGVRMGSGTKPSLTLKDAEVIENTASGVLAVAPYSSASAQLTYGNQNWATTVAGTTASYLFIRNYEIIEDTNIIIFVEEKVDKNQVYEVIEKKAIVCDIEYLKPMQLIARLKKVCFMYKVNVDDSTLNYLIETAGIDLQNLMNEIRKLIEYTGEGNTITKEAVKELAIKQIESVVFDLTDNLGNKKTEEAMEVLDNLVYQKEPLQRILVTLYTHFKRLYFCALAVKDNVDVISALSLKPNQTFLVNKYKKQTSYFKINQLRDLLEELVNLDYNSKMGNIDIDIGLRSILCSYCS